MSTSFEPGDDICPPWWPWWWRRGPFPPKGPKGFERYEQHYLTLAIHQLASQLQDKKLGKTIQEAAGGALREQAGSLGQ